VEEAWYKGIVGAYLRLSRAIVVPIDNPGSVVDKAVAAAKEGRSVVIFPQGGLSDNIVTKPKSGAARIALKAKVPLIPLRLTNSQDILLRGGLPHFRRTDIIIGKAIDTRGFDADSVKDWRKLTAKIAETINDL
jgi:1-acyl-sn-glycerol-3-phosphate acyltransferase